ncbi:RNA polymerase sporulation sigma factor SigH [Patulibacter brassicae]|uniref:RNA polymerase sporulation sigma factor SigH n=1 Tax=Patulibacter brassicae TaxID=1705717 RepID=A0ABU4VMI4_9ACTN|nr:RNA polymerase sporulation sigma factor SigH [Patulibacter brassicae]MDX8153043.1 RNA polymerase sporulation sigma factor SigH [Patulibacter brassicae]
MAQTSINPRSRREVEDSFLIARAKRGDEQATNQLIRRYQGFVRLKASSFFLSGGDRDDLVQYGLMGLYEAIRDFRSDRESSFRNFAELCITRRMITAIKADNRHKAKLLNDAVSLSSPPPGASEGEGTLHEVIAGPAKHDPARLAVDRDELRALVSSVPDLLSDLESRVLALYLRGRTYEQISETLGSDTKRVDNALQRVKRKIGEFLREREGLPRAA